MINTSRFIEASSSPRNGRASSQREMLAVVPNHCLSQARMDNVNQNTMDRAVSLMGQGLHPASTGAFVSGDVLAQQARALGVSPCPPLPRAPSFPMIAPLAEQQPTQNNPRQGVSLPPNPLNPVIIVHIIQQAPPTWNSRQLMANPSVPPMRRHPPMFGSLSGPPVVQVRELPPVLPLIRPRPFKNRHHETTVPALKKQRTNNNTQAWTLMPPPIAIPPPIAMPPSIAMPPPIAMLPREAVYKPLAKKRQNQSIRRDADWNVMYQRLVSYKAQHGNCLVPTRYADDPNLGYWVQNQCSRKKELSDEQFKLLDAIGFSWNFKSQHDAFCNMFNRLVAYKEKYGHCLVPRLFGDRRLGKWVNTQRNLKKKGVLLPEREAMLVSIGFTWNVKTLKHTAKGKDPAKKTMQTPE